MTAAIHPLAVVDPSVRLGENVTVGPFCVIGPDAEIGDNTVLMSHVRIDAHTILGRDCQVSPGAVVGGPPQDLGYKDEPTRVRIGDRARIRECVTINRSTGEGTETVVGDDCFMMAYSHLAHNCRVGNHVIMANAVQIAGHVTLGDYVFLGGAALVHQHVKVGRMAFIGGASAARKDAPPFSMNSGNSAAVCGINMVGLRRRGFSAEERQRLKKAFFYLWFAGLNQTQAIETIRTSMEVDDYIEELLLFIQTSKRGIGAGRPKRRDRAANSEEEASDPDMADAADMAMA